MLASVLIICITLGRVRAKSLKSTRPITFPIQPTELPPGIVKPGSTTSLIDICSDVMRTLFVDSHAGHRNLAEGGIAPLFVGIAEHGA